MKHNKILRVGLIPLMLALTAMGGLTTPTAKAAELKGNVALTSLGATATTSGVETGTAHVATNAIDGDYRSRWSSNYDDQAWLAVQLAQPTVIHHVTIWWHYACAAKYVLQVSADGQNWVDASAEVSPTCGTKEVRTLAAPADPAHAYKYVKIQARDRVLIGGAKWGVSLFDLEVWDKPDLTPATYGNVALTSRGGLATASGQQGDEHTPDKAIDGNQTSNWVANAADNAQLTVGLLHPTVINKVKIKWANPVPKLFKIQVSRNAKAWVDAVAQLAASGADTVQELTLTAPADPAFPYLFVRLQIIERHAAGDQVAVNELEIWDSAESSEPPPTPNPTINVIPKPVSTEVGPGPGFTVTSTTRIAAAGDTGKAAAELANRLRAATGFAVPIVETAQDGDIVLAVDPAAEYPNVGPAGTDEAYRLTVRANRVTITGKTGAGVFYGVQTLKQLFPTAVEAKVVTTTVLTAPEVTITDAPRFDHRGFMLDVARSFLTVAEVKKSIDRIAATKMSRLHLHLTDDQGWRIEITNDGKEADDPIDYAQLTEISGKTAMNQRGYQNEVGLTGFYTQADYREIVAYAEARYVKVIPEIDMPGHSNAVLHAITQLNTANSLPKPAPGQLTPNWNGTGDVGYSAFDPDAELTYKFLKHILTQVGAMSNGDAIHIGGDEAHEMAVQVPGGYQRFMDRALPMAKAVAASTGKRVTGWHEYAAAGSSHEGNYWDGYNVQWWVGGNEPVKNFVAKGGKAIVSLVSRAYLSQKNNASIPLGGSWACPSGCDWDVFYSWDPVTLSGVPETAVLGIEGAVWAESIRHLDQIDLMSWPRLAALAEVGWTTAANKDQTDFGRRLGAYGPRMTLMGGNYYESPTIKWGHALVGADLAVRPGVAAAWPVAYLAAPGTKIGAGAATIVQDSSSTDGDSATQTTLGAAPISAKLVCPGRELPLQFTTATARDVLHGAAAYVLAAPGLSFDQAATCTVSLMSGTNVVTDTSANIKVTVDAPLPPTPFTPTGAAILTFADGAQVVANDRWHPITLGNYPPNTLVPVTIVDADGQTTVLAARTDANGAFTGSVPLVRTVAGGVATLTAATGGQTATVTFTVDSVFKPLRNKIAQSALRIDSFDSENVADGALAAKAIDGDPATFWHTKWAGGSDPYPHFIALDLGATYEVTGFEYLNRQGQTNGAIKGYEFYVSADKAVWHKVATGDFGLSSRGQVVEFPDSVTGNRGRYVKLVAVSPLTAVQVWASAAELNIGGLPVGQSPTPTVEPTVEPTPTPTMEPTATPTPTVTLTPTPTVKPTPTLTVTPTPTLTSKPTISPSSLPSSRPTVLRWSGKTAVDTAIAVVDNFGEQKPGGVVYLANDVAAADALAAGPAAAVESGVLLLTAPNLLSAATEAKLLTLKPTKIVLQGGKFALAAGVEARVKRLFSTAEVTRNAGKDSVGTGVKTVRQAFGKKSVKRVFMANNVGLADALGGAAVAGRLGAPVVLVSPTDTISADVLELLREIQTREVVLLGGKRALPSAIETKLKQSGLAVSRKSGPSVIDTTLAAATLIPNLAQVFVANQAGVLDALAAAPVAARSLGVVILSDRTCLTPSVSAYLKAKDPARVILVGGKAALSEDLMRLPTCR